MGYLDAANAEYNAGLRTTAANSAKAVADAAIAAAQQATTKAPINATQAAQQQAIVDKANAAVAAYNNAAAKAAASTLVAADPFGISTNKNSIVYDPNYLKSSGFDSMLYTPTTGLSGGSVQGIKKEPMNITYSGTGSSRMKITQWSDGTTTSEAAPDTSEADNAKKQAVELFRASLTEYGLTDLADEVDKMIRDDFSVSQIKLELPKTESYKLRFPGMQALKNAGKAINEATYISTERAYDTVLRANGIDTKLFGTTEKYGTYIANQVSPVEFETRVSIAANRVNKNSDVVSALNNYYGVSKTGALSYLLDPTIGLDLVQKETRAAEIGAAAAATNFSFGEGATGAAVAESFINASGTQDLVSLKTEFGKARNLANTQGRLAGIEGESYSDLNAVTAVLAQDQQMILESQRRAAREAARFSGSSGITAGSLRTESNI